VRGNLRRLAIALAGAAWLGAGARAQDLGGADRPQQPVDVRAESLVYERERNVYVASGDVVIEQPGRRLTADWVTFNPDTGNGVASGHVVITEGGDRLEAEFLHFDVETLEGVVFQGRLDSSESRFRLTGDEVRRTGPESYEFREGSFTTCRCPEPGRDPWMIRADRADLEIEGYGTARNTTFEVLGVPVVWLPWMIYPLKRERQTGVLFPEIGTSSRTGFDVGLPLFWAARDDLNVTFTPHWLSERGFKPNLGLEYVYGEYSRGELFGTFIHDLDVDPDDPDTRFDEDRWAARAVHDHWFSESGDTRFKLDATALSDNLFSFDFDDFPGIRRDRFVESRAFYTSSLGSLGSLPDLGLSGALQWADDQQNPDDQDRDRFLLQRLPHLQTSLPPAPLRLFGQALAPSFDVAYTYFHSRSDLEDVYPQATIVGDDLFADTGVDSVPDGDERRNDGSKAPAPNPGDPYDPLLDPNRDSVGGPSSDAIFNSEGDGIFQEGELLADRGHRVLMNPRLALPLRVGDLVDVYPELGYHGTYYTTRAQSLRGRHLFTAQLDLSTQLRRALELPFGGGQGVHVVEPHLKWTGLTNADQDDDPLFVPSPFVPQTRVRQLDLYNVTRDPADRLEAVDAITLAFANRVYGRGTKATRLFADVVVSSQFEFHDDEGVAPLYLDGTLFPARDWRSRLVFGYDPDESRVSEGLVSVGWFHPAGHDVDLRYRYLHDIPLFFEDFRSADERFDAFSSDFERVNQIALNMRAALTRRWAVTYSGVQSFEDSLSLNNTGGVEYTSGCQCWALRVEVGDDRQRGVRVGVAYTVLGLGRDDQLVRPFSGRSGGARLLEPR
jgi:lipopolysaccharide assembly outer membrane protein LptD (OstA)